MSEDNISDIKTNIYTLHERSQQTKSDLASHEAVCSERYKNIHEKLDNLNDIVTENNRQIAELHKIASESKMSFKTIMFIGTVVAGIAGFVYTIMNIINQQ